MKTTHIHEVLNQTTDQTNLKYTLSQSLVVFETLL